MANVSESRVNFTALNTNALSENGYELMRDPLYVVIPITIIYVVIFFTGLVGNVSTCIVISRNKSMHTATNYYLFSLAISDLLLLITGLPPEVYMIWSKYPYVFGEVFCVLRGLAAETSANATILTITAFTIERYIAICHPFLSHTMSRLSRAIKLILLIWLVALGFAIPQALQFGLVMHNNMAICTQKIIILKHSFEIATFLFFVLPMTLITVLYALIGFRLRSSNMMKRERSTCGQGTIPLRAAARSNGNRRSNGTPSRRVVKMLVAVVVAFFICWAPFHAQRLVAIYGTIENHQAISPTMFTIYMIMTYISGVLYYVSTTINPVLYHIMSHKFREAFKETMAKCWCGSDRHYSELARTRQSARFGFVPQDSTDYSGNSIREESITSGGLQRNDTLKTFQSQRSMNRNKFAEDVDTCTQNFHIENSRAIYANKCLRAVQCTDSRGLPLRTQIPDKKCNHGLCSTTDEPKIHPRNFSSDYFSDRSNQFCYIFKLNRGRNNYMCSACRERNYALDKTQTDTECPNMMYNISNSSLKDVDKGALEDELTSYMEEIHLREREKRLATRQA